MLVVSDILLREVELDLGLRRVVLGERVGLHWLLLLHLHVTLLVIGLDIDSQLLEVVSVALIRALIAKILPGEGLLVRVRHVVGVVIRTLQICVASSSFRSTLLPLLL